MPGAAQEEEAQLLKSSSVPDIRLGWICQRVCSSLKTKEDAFQRLLASEARFAAIPHLSSCMKLLATEFCIN